MTVDRSHHELVCSICHGEFDIDLEGGISGELGILPVSLCAMCYSGLSTLFNDPELYEQMEAAEKEIVYLRQRVNALTKELNQKDVD